MLDAALRFQFYGQPVSCELYGNGHINQTYLVLTDRAERYILQRVNDGVFHDVPRLMENIAAVTRYLAEIDPNPRRVLTIVPTLGGKTYHVDTQGGYWRAYVFVKDSVCLERAESPRDFQASGTAFGRFQRQLAGFPAVTLHETIERFHDTPNRYAFLLQAAEKDILGRLIDAKPELDFFIARQQRAGVLTALRESGELPARVTHNDTKLNNVLLDSMTREPLCVIDLDTVMPGLAAYDFGDSIRYGASTAAEDEKNLDRVELSLDMYRHFCEGFLGECGESLTRSEVQTLPLGAWTMTVECGVRFLTDYLSGDTYFRIHRPRHNLDRCRTQMRLVAAMERKWAQMHSIVDDLARES